MIYKQKHNIVQRNTMKKYNICSFHNSCQLVSVVSGRSVVRTSCQDKRDKVKVFGIRIHNGLLPLLEKFSFMVLSNAIIEISFEQSLIVSVRTSFKLFVLQVSGY